MSYRQIATTTLATNASSLTFSNIPQTFRDLVLVVQARQTVSNAYGIRLNNDSQNNYSIAGISWDSVGGSPNSNYLHNQAQINVSAGFANGGTDDWARNIIQIFDYSTTQPKTTLIRAGNVYAGTNGRVQAFTAGRYADTTAITSVTFISINYQLTENTTATLYGIGA